MALLQAIPSPASTQGGPSVYSVMIQASVLYPINTSSSLARLLTDYNADRPRAVRGEEKTAGSVSYTHLTLPTILRV